MLLVKNVTSSNSLLQVINIDSLAVKNKSYHIVWCGRRVRDRLPIKTFLSLPPHPPHPRVCINFEFFTSLNMQKKRKKISLNNRRTLYPSSSWNLLSTGAG